LHFNCGNSYKERRVFFLVLFFSFSLKNDADSINKALVTML